MDTINKKLRILFVGPERLETDSAGLFRSFRRMGHVVRLVNEEKFYPEVYFNFVLKIMRKAFRSYFVKEYNQRILKEAQILNPDICIVFKGNMVMPETLKVLKEKGVRTVCFYTDVSFYTHGSLIPKCIPLYDFVFSTKSFHLEMVPKLFGQQNIFFLPHGFDPEVHKPWNPTKKDLEVFGSDVTFIGSWSPKKEKLLSRVAQYALQKRIIFKVWGNRWNNVKDKNLRKFIMGMPLEGDLYALGISCSKIVLGLLSEQVGKFPGDRVTSRTFNIPGSGGFMLHERTDEVLHYFEEGKEIACFGNEDELIEKIDYYLTHDKEREKIRKAGYKKALAEHTWDKRAESILERVLEHK